MSAPRMHRRVRAFQQAGLTLIELMVAVLMALFMAAALLFVYVGMRNSFLAQDRLAQLQDNQRVALSMLSSTIEVAGYFASPRTDTSATALPAKRMRWPNGASSVFAPGQVVLGTGSGMGNNTQSDAIAVRFQTANNDDIQDCNGGINVTGTNQEYNNIFSINANNELVCSVNGNPAVALASNVGRMQILYGTNTLNAGTIDAYLTAASVSTQNLWPRVRSVKIRLFFMDTSQTPPVLLTNSLLQFISLQNQL